MRNVALFLLLVHLAKGRVTCRGLDGEPVDWFVVYKPPIHSESNPQFYYADDYSSTWTLGSLPITSSKTAVGATLKPFYKRNKKQFMFAYNDDSPIGKAKSYRGHSKGVLVFDGKTGFWLIHSVPNFPPLGSYSYPESGMKFGQIFLCLSLSTELLGDIGDHLRYVQATPFFSNLPEKFSERFPVLVNIVKKQSLSRSARKFTRVGQLNTIQGMKLTSFAKHKKFNKDLWLDLVAPELDTSLDVESWLNGAADDLDSTCTRRTSVYDVSAVNLPDVSFDSSRDHSKWAVADKDGRKSIVCVGDLNRQKSQFHRGGGAVCFQHFGLWLTLHNSVDSVQPCISKNIRNLVYSSDASNK